MIGIPVTIILLIIGVIRGLLKKKWKLAKFSAGLFVLLLIFYLIAQRFYTNFLRPSVINNLQEISKPRPLNPDGSANFNY